MTAGRLEAVRVLVTRPRERAETLCFLLEDEGAEVLSLPMLELMPPEDPRPLHAAAEHLGRYAFIALASESAVHALAESCRLAGTLDRLRTARIAAVGARTARALEDHGLVAAVVAQRPTGEGLAEAMRPHLDPGQEVLVPGAQEGRTELADALEEAGVSTARVAAYRSQKRGIDEAAREQLLGTPPQVAIFASPRTAEAFLEASEPWGRALLERAARVAIGPTTAAALSELGLSAKAVATAPTPEALVEAAVLAAR
jgi:uroporphyrinogen-III synthase